MKGLGRLIERAGPAPFTGRQTASSWSGGVPFGSSFGLRGSKMVGGATPASATMGIPVNESTTMSISAAWRCEHILTDGIAALDIFAYDDDNQDERIESPKVLLDPWPVVSPVEWRAMVVASLTLHGNAYLLPWDADPRTGYPRQLPIVHPNEMRIDLVRGRPRYRLVGSDVDLDVLHIRGLMMPGAVAGIGVIEAQRRGIGLALDMEAYQGGNFQQSSVPPVIIRVNRPEISEEQAQDIQGKWVNKHGYGQRAPAVIPTSMDVNTLAWSPEDTQFLESKQFMASEICWWFGIDPRVLGLSASGQSLTYSNVESTYVDLQRMSFLPWTSRIEAALSRVMPRHVMARFDFTPMLRTTLQDRYSAYKMGIEGGWLTVEEVRSFENLGPLGSPPMGLSPGGVETMRNQVNPSIPIIPQSTMEVSVA
jgi:HK97 family phage portal protein